MEIINKYIFLFFKLILKKEKIKENCFDKNRKYVNH